MANDVRCPGGWRNWLSVGATSSRFAVPPILPPPVWYPVSSASMPDGKRCETSPGRGSWLSVGTTSSRFAEPPILPLRLWYTVPRVFMPNGKRCKMSLGLELSLRASSFYIYDIIKIGRIAVAFLGNAADKRRLRTTLGSVHGIIEGWEKCISISRERCR